MINLYFRLLELTLGVGVVRLKSLRVFRVLRPLRSINAIKSKNFKEDNVWVGIRRLVSALLLALPEFVHVAVFLIFIFILFAILGVH